MIYYRLTTVAVLLFFAAFSFPQTVPGLEKLSKEEMRNLTGQAGISLAVGDDAVFFHWRDSVKFQDINTRDMNGTTLSPDGYVKFDTKALLKADEIFKIDAGIFYGEDLEFTDETPDGGEVIRTFEHPLNDTAMIFFSHTANNNPEAYFSALDISVYNHGLSQESLLGDVDVSGINIYENRFQLYPPQGEGGSGVRAMAGTRLKVDSAVYANPDRFENIFVTGLLAGSGFSGAPENPENWAFEDGMFELGIPYYYHDDSNQQDTELDSYPFTLDIGTDADRPGDFESFIAINAPIRGSIRVKNISSSDGFDTGPIAIDGIRIYKNYIEFPGRGIGN